MFDPFIIQQKQNRFRGQTSLQSAMAETLSGGGALLVQPAAATSSSSLADNEACDYHLDRR